jgi:hypothetical protein
VTLKLKRRQEGAPEPAKFMGHGACDNLSRCGGAAAAPVVPRAGCRAGQLSAELVVQASTGAAARARNA